MKYYVNAAQAAKGNGSQGMPFATINEVAAIAKPGDEVIVAHGIYREDVNLVCGGAGEDARIVYRSEVPLAAVITGAELLSGWEDCGDGIFKTAVDNTAFADDNPFTNLVYGDWYYFDPKTPVHRADVFLDGASIASGENV